jgi:hypothetical protein
MKCDPGPIARRPLIVVLASGERALDHVKLHLL